MQKILSQELALLSAPTAFGKTVVAAAMIAKRGVNTLILVHRQQLIDQWKERLNSFLDLAPKSIGQIGAGRKKPKGIVDITMIQSLVSVTSLIPLAATSVYFVRLKLIYFSKQFQYLAADGSVCILTRPIRPIAQLVRAPGFEPGGQGFESLRARFFSRVHPSYLLTN